MLVNSHSGLRVWQISEWCVVPAELVNPSGLGSMQDSVTSFSWRLNNWWIWQWTGLSSNSVVMWPSTTLCHLLMNSDNQLVTVWADISKFHIWTCQQIYTRQLELDAQHSALYASAHWALGHAVTLNFDLWPPIPRSTMYKCNIKDKSNSILFATTQHAHFLPDQISVNISGVSIPLCNHVKILGAVLDSRITLSQHTKAVSKSCFYHIRASGS